MLMSSSELWRHLLPIRDQNMAGVGLCFRVLSSMDCLVHAMLTAQHRKFPFQLFSVLIDQSMAARIASSPECVLGEFVRDFLAKSQEHGGLLGAVSMSKLHLLAMMAEVNTATIEAKHASIRRRLFSRGVQTHGESLEEVSAEWVVDQLRLQGVAWHNISGTDGSAAELGSEADSSTTQVSRAGGAWRAYVRKESLGKQGLQNSTELSQKYKMLPASEKKQLVDIGNAATVVGVPEGRGSSFGLRSREVVREQVRMQKSAPISTVVALRSTSGTPLPVGELVARTVDTAVAGKIAGNMQEMLTSARQSLRAVRRADRQKQLEAESALEKWVDDAGAAMVKQFVEAVPAVGPVAASLQGVPQELGPCMRYRMNTRLAAEVGHFAAGCGHQSKLPACLETDWSAKHKPILQSESPTIREADGTRKRKSTAPPSCDTVGFCICGSEKMLVTLRSNAIKEMKRPFRLNSANKALLLDKFIVLKLRGHRKGDTSHWGRAIARLEQRSPEPEDKVFFLHIGHPCLSPYEPTFKVMDFLYAEEYLGCQEIHLQVLGRLLV